MVVKGRLCTATGCLPPHPSLKCLFLVPDLPLAEEKGFPVLCAWTG